MLENIPFILAYANIAQAQPGDAQLQLLCTQKPNQYTQNYWHPICLYGSAHAATVYKNTWLARYPKPTTCIYDQGSEFL
jgi:hypothetical protein